MDNKRRDHPDPNRAQERNHPLHLPTHNVPTDEVENTNGTNLGGDIRFSNKPWTFFQRTERLRTSGTEV